MAGFMQEKVAKSTRAKAASRQLHFKDLSYLLIDEINCKFKKHGKILGWCMEKFSADIQFKTQEDAETALNAENGNLFHGKVLKISMRNDRAAFIRREKKPLEDIIFFPKCDMEPNVEKRIMGESTEVLNMNDEGIQDRLMPVNSLPEPLVDIKPIFPEENLVQIKTETKPTDNKQVCQARKKISRRSIVQVFGLFEIYLKELGSKCNRICIGKINSIIFPLLKDRFQKYGEISAFIVRDSYAVIQYETKEQADAACKAECCGTLLSHTFELKRCCTVTDKSRNGTNLLLQCPHDQKRKHEASELKKLTTKRLRVRNNECQIIVISDTAKSKYDSTKVKLEEYGLNLDVLFLNDNVSILSVISGTCLSIRIEPIDENHRVIKAEVVYGRSPSKLRAKEMTLDELANYIASSYIYNLRTNTHFNVVEKSTQTQMNCQSENEMETIDNQDIQVSNGVIEEDLKEHIVKIENIVENLNDQLTVCQKKFSELNKYMEKLKCDNMNSQENHKLPSIDFKANNELIQALQDDAGCLKYIIDSLRNNGAFR